MGVRVWGTVEGRLVELLGEAAPSGSPGFRIEGLPPSRTRTTTDRVLAALINSGLLEAWPSAVIRLEPPLRSGPTALLDAAIAVAVLVQVGAIGSGLTWIHAGGRLGLNGQIFFEDGSGGPELSEICRALCQTPPLESEHMFVGEKSP